MSTFAVLFLFDAKESTQAWTRRGVCHVMWAVLVSNAVVGVL